MKLKDFEDSMAEQPSTASHMDQQQEAMPKQPTTSQTIQIRRHAEEEAQCGVPSRYDRRSNFIGRVGVGNPSLSPWLLGKQPRLQKPHSCDAKPHSDLGQIFGAYQISVKPW